MPSIFEEVRGDEPLAAAKLRVEERELKACVVNKRNRSGLLGPGVAM